MRRSLLLASVAVLGASGAAFAQDNTPAPAASETAPASATQGSVATADAAVADDAGEIIVTATRRASSLASVPIAVSAVTAQSLQNSGASDIRQLNQLAPSLLVSSTGNEANGSARIRGIGTVGDNPGLESSVAVFIDGVYRSRTGSGLNELGEIERVEVLRGPQGTLFGRNASAGLINIISKKPSYEIGGGAALTYGNYDYWRAEGSVTGPIVADKLAARIDGVYAKRDGFLKDVIGGKRVNDRDRYFVRGQLLAEPNDDLEFRIIGDYSRRNESCCGATYLPTRETFDPTRAGEPATVNSDGAVSDRPNSILPVLQSFGGVINEDTFSRRISVTPGRSYDNVTTDYGLSGQADWKLGFGTLTSITAYRHYKSEGAADLDYNNVDLLYRTDDSYRQFNTFTQELRLQGSAFDDRLDWLVGGYYANEHLKLTDDTTFGAQYGPFAACRFLTLISPSAALRNPAAPGCLSPAGTATLAGAFGPLAPAFISGLNRLSTVVNSGDAGSVYRQNSENYALFTHNIFKLTDTLSVTLGARYTHEAKDFRARIVNNNGVCPAQQAALGPTLGGIPAGTAQALLGALINLTCQGNSSSQLNGLTLADKRRESEWTGTAVVSNKFSDRILGYASYSKGYKAGGFNLDRSALGSPLSPRSNADVANLQFSPEKVNAYEVGVKFNGRAFDLNVAGFRQEFENFQLNTFNGSVFLVQNINACDTSLGGADRDASAATGACTGGKTKAGVISQGVELEAAMYPMADLAITTGLTYADTHYKQNLVGGSNGVALDPALFLLPGGQLSNAPKYVVTGSLAYTPDIPNSNLSALFYVDYRAASDYNTGSDLFPEKRQDGYALVNARIGLRGPAQRWSVEFWGQNIFDKQYQQVAFNAPYQGSNSVAQTQAFGSTANQLFGSFLAEPRTYGVTIRTKF